MSTLQPVTESDNLDKVIEKINNFMNIYQTFEGTTQQTLTKHTDIIDVGANVVANKISHKLYVFKSIAALKAYEHLYIDDICVLLGDATEFNGNVQYYKIRVGTEIEDSPNLLVTIGDYRAELVPDSRKQEIQQEITKINADILKVNEELVKNNTAIVDALATFQQLKTMVEGFQGELTKAIEVANAASITAANAEIAVSGMNDTVTKHTQQIGNLYFSVTADNILKISWT